MLGTCRGMFYNKFTKDDQSATNQIEGLGKKKTMLHILDWVISKCNTQFTFVLTNQTSHKYYWDIVYLDNHFPISTPMSKDLVTQ